ncbi:LysR family transcriptional regulator [Cryptosporangium phraense]|uniref:LysR family transcriptional regulator n=1 Tax=Cryptosporangium phraense TaxID=2593070 RepID=A0A545AGR8_9ACTN|nr:LysR family transcriptional regulator [Cryptosporangium phraense]
MRYFVAVAEELSFTAAAGKLRIAQQSLSQQIATLERRLGARLFDRDTRGTRLTDVGRVFLPEARAVLARADQAVATVGRAARGEVGRVRLAFLASAANTLLPPIVRALRERFGDWELTTDAVSIAELVSGLRADRYDVGFGRPPCVDDLATRVIATEPVCAVLPADHALAGRETVRLAELRDEPWVLTPRDSWLPWHLRYDEEYAAAGFSPRVVAEGSSVQNLLALVAAGVGVTRLAASSRSLRGSGVVFVPLEGEVAETVATWRRSAPVVDHVVSVVADLAATTDLTRD